MGGTGQELLRVRGLTKRFGGVPAVNDLDLSIQDGEVLGLIGPNGAGKSTFIGLISGTTKATSGSIAFGGQEITQLRASTICRLGLARTYQIVRPLPALSVLENVMIGAYCRTHRPTEARRRGLEVLEFTGLMGQRDILARNLTIAHRKRLEIARALATVPKLLLLDEVMSGLNPTESAQAVELLYRIKERGITMVVIEHVMRVVMSVSDRVVVLHHGEMLASGTPTDVVSNPAVITAYLGDSLA